MTVSDTEQVAHRLLAHRGLWGAQVAGNTEESLLDAWTSGFGVETDIRDYLGELVVSHDPPSPTREWLRLEKLLGRLHELHEDGTVALNVKADGIPALLDAAALSRSSLNYFCFDMSWPQTLSFVKAGIPVALRVSEWEPLDISLFRRLEIPVRVWLDAFESDWWLESQEIVDLCQSGQVIVVSPEIHGREPEPVWEWFEEQVRMGADVFLCSDRCIDVQARFR